MLSRLVRLFHRYCDHHFAIYAKGFSIFDTAGERIGQVERICFGRMGVRLEGWCIADQVSLSTPGKHIWQKPDILRADVNAALGLNDTHRAGFNLSLLGDPSGVALAMKTDLEMLQFFCPSVGRAAKVKARLHILLSFAKASLRAAPAVLRAYFSPNVVNRTRAKRALGLGHREINNILDEGVFETAKIPGFSQKVTLIMPVFNAFEVLQIALNRIAENTDVPWRLILVEDCSRDARVRPMIEGWACQQQAIGFEIEVLANEKNLGFIGSVNRAFAHALQYGDHVVLVNSDALVPQGWAQRLLLPILRNASVASVTPLSNDAEIFSSPKICHATPLEPGVGDAIDKSLKCQTTPFGYSEAPTGVGFCMAINITYLRKVPEFDAVFGKGYGEEVDWCQRVARLGGLHVCQPNLFVEHRGGASFGSNAKQKAIAQNNQIVSTRYPQYDLSVQRFIAKDPLRTQRLFAAVAYLAATQGQVSIYIAHSLGGGAELYLQEKLAKHNEEGRGAIVLRVGGVLRWRIEVHTPSGVELGDTDYTELLHQIVAPIDERNLIYSCAVGDPDPLEITQFMEEIVSNKSATFSFLVHDYFAISPSYCLLDSDNVYRGVPNPKPFDQSHVFNGKNGFKISHEDWYKSWQRILDLADQVICFSNNSADLMSEAFPCQSGKILISSHSVSPVPRVQTCPSRANPSIGVLGSIGLQKGAHVVSQLSDEVCTSMFQNIVVVGNIDPNFPLGQNCIETGTYKRNEIATLAKRHNIQVWLIPSIWPETFSYTTHEALATGLPVFAFDLGAQGDAVTLAANGCIIPIELSKSPRKLLPYLEEVFTRGATSERINSKAENRRNRGFAA